MYANMDKHEIIVISDDDYDNDEVIEIVSDDETDKLDCNSSETASINNDDEIHNNDESNNENVPSSDDKSNSDDETHHDEDDSEINDDDRERNDDDCESNNDSETNSELDSDVANIGDFSEFDVHSECLQDTKITSTM